MRGDARLLLRRAPHQESSVALREHELPARHAPGHPHPAVGQARPTEPAGDEARSRGASRPAVPRGVPPTRRHVRRRRREQRPDAGEGEGVRPGPVVRGLRAEPVVQLLHGQADRPERFRGLHAGAGGSARADRSAAVAHALARRRPDRHPRRRVGHARVRREPGGARVARRRRARPGGRHLDLGAEDRRGGRRARGAAGLRRHHRPAPAADRVRDPARARCRRASRSPRCRCRPCSSGLGR